MQALASISKQKSWSNGRMNTMGLDGPSWQTLITRVHHQPHAERYTGNARTSPGCRPWPGGCCPIPPTEPLEVGGWWSSTKGHWSQDFISVTLPIQVAISEMQTFNQHANGTLPHDLWHLWHIDMWQNSTFWWALLLSRPWGASVYWSRILTTTLPRSMTLVSWNTQSEIAVNRSGQVTHTGLLGLSRINHSTNKCINNLSKCHNILFLFTTSSSCVYVFVECIVLMTQFPYQGHLMTGRLMEEGQVYIANNRK